MTRLTPCERETIINWDQESDSALIFTYDRALVAAMRSNPAAVELRREPAGGTEFRIPKHLIVIRRPRGRPGDPKLADRMAKVRAAKGKQ